MCGIREMGNGREVSKNKIKNIQKVGKKIIKTRRHQTPQGEEMLDVLQTRGEYNFSLAQRRLKARCGSDSGPWVLW